MFCLKELLSSAGPNSIGSPPKRERHHLNQKVCVCSYGGRGGSKDHHINHRTIAEDGPGAHGCFFGSKRNSSTPNEDSSSTTCLQPSLILSVSTHPSLELPSCPTHWILIPACHGFFFFSLTPNTHHPAASPDPCCVSSNYHSTEKTLSFKALAIISVEHNKMASPQEEGEVWAVVRRCMSCCLSLEVEAKVAVLQGMFYFLLLPPLMLVR